MFSEFSTWGRIALFIAIPFGCLCAEMQSVQDGDDGATDRSKTGGLAKTSSFTRISNTGPVVPSGTPLGSAPSNWACTRENGSELLFEVKVDSPSTLRHRDHTYSWQDTNSANNGGNAGTAGGGACTGSTCDTQSYVTAVNAAVLCGFSDWRLPRKDELQRLVDPSSQGTGQPTINAAFFPNMTAGAYWTRANFAGNAALAWMVSMDDGRSTYRAKVSTIRVLLVRGAP